MVARTFQLNVVAPPTTYAAQLASGMASNTLSTPTLGRAGTAGTRINESVGDLGQTFTAGKRAAFNNYATSNYFITQWTGKAHCDGVNWWYIGGTTGSAAGNLTAVKYDVALDEFRHWTGLGVGDASGLFGQGQSHNFELTAWNPVTRRLLHTLSQTNPAVQAEWNPDLAASGVSGAVGTWAWPASIGYFSEFFSLACHPGMGTAGTIIVPLHSGYTEVRRLDISSRAALASVYAPNATSGKPSVCYHTLSNHAAGFVYYTSGGSDLRFFKVSASGVVTSCANTPTRMQANGDTDPTSHTILCPLGNYIYAFKLANTATDRGIYRYDPQANVWTNTNTNLSGLTLADSWFTVGPLDSVGVALIVYAENATGESHKARIWKP